MALGGLWLGPGSPSDPSFPQIIKKLIERKQAQIRKVYPGLSCFKEGVRQIPVESVPGIREQGFWWGEQGALLGVYQAFLGMFSPLPALQERRAGSRLGRRRGECCVAGEGVGGGRGIRSRRRGISHPRKELKDPDQLYTTLKNLLAQIKVGRPGSLLGVPAPVAVALWPSVGWVAVTSWAWGSVGLAPAWLSSPVTPQCLALHGAREEVGGPGLL